MHALTESDLDAHIADKRIFHVVGRDGEEVGRIFSAPKTCTGNCNQGRACDCVADVETEWTPAQLQYLRVIAYVGSPVFVVGVIALAALYLH